MPLANFGVKGGWLVGAGDACERKSLSKKRRGRRSVPLFNFSQVSDL